MADTTLNHIIVVDSREQLPYQFLRWKPSICYAPLETGDYSLLDYENMVAVERKSLQDFYGSIGKGRDRFLREMERLSGYPYKLLVIESSALSALRPEQHQYTRLVRSQVLGSVTSLMTHYHIPILFADVRKIGEELVYYFLRKALRGLTGGYDEWKGSKR